MSFDVATMDIQAQLHFVHEQLAEVALKLNMLCIALKDNATI